jgi:hypothetical protein
VGGIAALGGSDGRSSGDGDRDGTPAAIAPSGPREAAGGAQGEAYAVDRALAGASSASAGGSAEATASAPGDSALVVKTGSLQLEVDEGGYDRTVEVLTTKVAGVGGYVAESRTSRAGEHPSGTLVLRVPTAAFDTLLADARQLGEVVGETSQGTDVSGQHTDLQARLSALRAARDKLSAILATARTVEETLSVQDRITDVQTQIEQLQGQLAALDDQVAMASLTVDLAEPGADRIGLRHDDDGLGGAWADARRRFGDGIERIVRWSGSAAVLALVAVALWAAVRLLRRRGSPLGAAEDVPSTARTSG